MEETKVKNICSNCGCETDIVYDVFGDGLILYCEECYIQYLAERKGLVRE